MSRSLAACEGALLVVDATQGVEAQTLANVYMALDHDLAIIPVINKIDLPSADVERTRTEIEDVIGIDASVARAHLGEGGDRDHRRSSSRWRRPCRRRRATRRRR